jgi:hypothetical protein
MVDVSREEFDALVKRVTALEGTPPKPIGLQVKALATGTSEVRIDWTPTIGKPVLKYEVGRDGTDNTGYGPWTGTFVASTKSTVFNKLGQSIYGFTVKTYYTDGTSESVLVHAAPLVPAPTVPVETTGRGALSGLPFNMTIFNGGDSNAQRMRDLGVVLGMPSFDGILTFMTRDNGWDAAKDNDLAKKAKAVLDAGGMVIWSLPHSMDGDANMNSIGAKNGYSLKQQDLARWMVEKGLNHPKFYLRPDWEGNGSWYHWTIHGPAGVEGLRDSLAYMRDNFELGGMTEPRWILCLNISDGGTECTWKDLDKNRDVFDVYTIDQYDAWPGVTSSAVWEQKMKSPQSLRNAIAQAKEVGCLAGIDEGGPWHTGDGAGDNPFYMGAVLSELMGSVDFISHWNIYNDAGAPANLFHDFGHNPKAYEALKIRLKPLIRKV